MPEVSDDTIAHLEKIAEKKEVPFEEVKEKYKEKYEEVEDKSSGVDKETIENLALRQLRSLELAQSRVSTEEIEMLTVGGDVRNTSNGDMFFGSAIVDEEPNDDSVPSKLGQVRVFDEELAVEVDNAFSQVGNIVTGDFAVSDGDLTNHLEVTDGDDTSFEVVRPDDRGKFVDEIRDMVPEVSISNIADNITQQTRGEDGEMYDVSSDIKRIRADVFDGYKNPDTGTGMYTLRDDTVFDDEDIENSPVFDPEEANESATPGMTCFIQPNKMEWGTGAVIDFFGTVKEDEGIVNFSADGAYPILTNDDGFDGYVDEEDEGEEIPERTESSGGSTRTKI